MYKICFLFWGLRNSKLRLTGLPRNSLCSCPGQAGTPYIAMDDLKFFICWRQPLVLRWQQARASSSCLLSLCVCGVYVWYMCIVVCVWGCICVCVVCVWCVCVWMSMVYMCGVCVLWCVCGCMCMGECICVCGMCVCGICSSIVSVAMIKYTDHKQPRRGNALSTSVQPQVTILCLGKSQRGGEGLLHHNQSGEARKERCLLLTAFSSYHSGH